MARIDDRARRWLIPGSDPATPTVSSCREMDAGTCRWFAEAAGSGVVWRLDGVDQLDIALAMSRDCWALRRLSTRSQDLTLSLSRSLSVSRFRYRLGWLTTRYLNDRLIELEFSNHNMQSQWTSPACSNMTNMPMLVLTVCKWMGSFAAVGLLQSRVQLLRSDDLHV